MKIYVLREGDRGQPVADMQGKLSRCKADGIWGPKTSKAVQSYQRKHGLGVDAVAGPETLGHMGLAPILGIDLSHHNGVVDWHQIAREGVGFAILKASEGLTWTDKRYARNVLGAASVGIPAAAYHYARVYNDPTAEARAAVAAAAPLKRVHLDVESHHDRSPEELGEWIAAWCAEYEKLTGLTAMIYTASWFAVPRLNDGRSVTSRVDPLKWPLWVADYVRASTRQVASEWDGSWPRQLLWQFSGSGHCLGVTGRVDLNWLFSVDGETAPSVAGITQGGCDE